MAVAWATKNVNSKSLITSVGVGETLSTTATIYSSQINGNLNGKKVTVLVDHTVVSGTATTGATNIYPSMDGVTWGAAIAVTGLGSVSTNSVAATLGYVDLSNYQGVPYWRLGLVPSATSGTTGQFKWTVALG
jgi:hypothetical protein